MNGIDSLRGGASWAGISSFILWSHSETHFQKIAFFLRLFYENYIDYPIYPDV
jgi:hypothetical protein